jgi:hypothetical protein
MVKPVRLPSVKLDTILVYFTTSTLSISTNWTYQDEIPISTSRNGPSRMVYANVVSYLPCFQCQNVLLTPSKDRLLVPRPSNINDCNISQSALLIYLRADFIKLTGPLIKFDPIAPYLRQLSSPLIEINSEVPNAIWIRLSIKGQ